MIHPEEITYPERPCILTWNAIQYRTNEVIRVYPGIVVIFPYYLEEVARFLEAHKN